MTNHELREDLLAFAGLLFAFAAFVIAIAVLA